MDNLQYQSMNGKPNIAMNLWGHLIEWAERLQVRRACDGRFYTKGDGIVIDMKMDIMWADRDNGSPVNFDTAKNYCANFALGGYHDWRMPGGSELTDLMYARIVTFRTQIFRKQKLIQVTPDQFYGADGKIHQDYFSSHWYGWDRGFIEFSEDGGFISRWDFDEIPYFKVIPVRNIWQDRIEELGSRRDIEGLMKYLRAQSLADKARMELDNILPNWRKSDAARKFVSDTIQGLKDTDDYGRHGAVIALGIMRSPTAVEALLQMLNDKNEEIKGKTRFALKQLTGADFGVNYKDWIKWWRENKG